MSAPPCLSARECFFYYTYHYVPNEFSASLDIALFALLTLVLGLQTLRYPVRYMWIIVATGCLEVLGYGLRILATQEATLGPYITTTLFLLMAPIALALVNYIVVAKLLRATGKSIGCMTADSLARIFLTSDVVCFFVQGGGGGLMASGDESTAKLGADIVLVGLAIQLAFFCTFTWVTYHIAYSPSFQLSRAPTLRPVFRGLFTTILLLLVRNVYRVAEFASGTDGYIVTHEWVFNIFETLPVFLAFVGYAVYHFGRLLPEGVDVKIEWTQQLAVVLGSDADNQSSSTTVPVEIGAAQAFAGNANTAVASV